MKEYEQRLQQYLQRHDIQGEQMFFQTTCHSVADAAHAVGAEPNDLVKNICLVAAEQGLVVAIVRGGDRVSMSRVARVLQVENLRVATAAEILERTGYPCGGVPSFGYEALFLVDPKVLERPLVYSGGGSAYSLVRLAPAELQRANGGRVERIRS